MEMIDQIKENMFAAMRTGRTVEKEVLQVVLGEIQSLQTKSGVKPPQEVIEGIIRKMTVSNEEVIKGLAKRDTDKDKAKVSKLTEENSILRDYLPPQLDCDRLLMCPEIKDAILAYTDKNTGKLIGQIISLAKQAGCYVEGGEVKKAIDILKTT